MGELDPAGRIYLYGSRADDKRRGGDIDIYFQASRPIELKAYWFTNCFAAFFETAFFLVRDCLCNTVSQVAMKN